MKNISNVNPAPLHEALAALDKHRTSLSEADGQAVTWQREYDHFLTVADPFSEADARQVAFLKGRLDMIPHYREREARNFSPLMAAIEREVRGLEGQLVAAGKAECANWEEEIVAHLRPYCEKGWHKPDPTGSQGPGLGPVVPREGIEMDPAIHLARSCSVFAYVPTRPEQLGLAAGQYYYTAGNEPYPLREVRYFKQPKAFTWTVMQTPADQAAFEAVMRERAAQLFQVAADWQANGGRFAPAHFGTTAVVPTALEPVVPTVDAAGSGSGSGRGVLARAAGALMPGRRTVAKA